MVKRSEPAQSLCGGYVTKTLSDNDERQSRLSLTRKGREAFAQVDRRQHVEIVKVLKGLSEDEQDSLIDAMRAIETILGKARVYRSENSSEQDEKDAGSNVVERRQRQRTRSV